CGPRPPAPRPHRRPRHRRPAAPGRRSRCWTGRRRRPPAHPPPRDKGRAMTETTYTVVWNDEEQYSIWEQGRPVPAGWRETGYTGSRERCLAHIDEVWTDMRPRSLRIAMGEA